MNLFSYFEFFLPVFFSSYYIDVYIWSFPYTISF
nr:MAG TPA: hypothetical protein [Caudoviricetes sp.]